METNVRSVVLTVLVPVLAAAQVFDGLTMYNLISNRTTYLKDNAGQTVNSWTSSYPCYMAYLLPDSTVWRMEVWPGSVMRGGPYGGLMRHYDWDRNLIEEFLWSDSNHQQHHDINVMPNGHVLVVSWDRKTRAQAESLGRRDITGDIWPDEVIEWDPVTRSVVWEWHFWDHLIQDVDPSKPNYGVVREHPERLDINLGSVRQGGDWMHCNTVDYNAARDEVILTSNHLSEMYVIDHSTTTEEARGSTGGRHGKGGDFIYRWGNPQNYRRGTSADRVFYTAHGANWIRPGMLGAGDILVLNNGDRPGTSGDSSSVIQLTPPLDSSDRYYIHPDSAFGPSSPTWRYSNGRTFYSQHLGGAYRLPNGNTLAVLGTTGMVHEITPAHQVVWTLNTGGQVGRATKYPRDFASGAVEESPNCAVRSAKDRPTIVRGVLLLGAGHDPNVRHSGSCPKPVLLDAIGRTVLDLTPGANDLGRIAPGVYFVLAGGRFSRTLLVR